MGNLTLDEISQWVAQHIEEFHQKKIDRLERLKLHVLLKRKNPYLFRIKDLDTPEALVRGLAEAWVSSQEETLFGNWLEQLAIFVNERAFGGRKSGIEGIDLEFERDNVLYLVTIKSGPDWGNSSQVKKMEELFKSAIKRFRTSGASVAVECVNGCCYGQRSADKGTWKKLCGQDFWEFISGLENLYVDLIIPLGHNARVWNEGYRSRYEEVLKKLIDEFSANFCEDDGTIDWEKIVRFNSGSRK